MPGRDVFDLPTVPILDDPEFGFLQDEPAQQTPTPEEEPVVSPEVEEPVPQESPEVSSELSEPSEPSETLEEAPPEPYLYAGKYKDDKALEQAYLDLRRLQTRTAERSKIAEMRVQEIEGRARQLEETLRRAIPYVQRAMAAPAPAQPQPPQADMWGEPVGETARQQPTQSQPQLTPEILDLIIRERLGQYQAQTQAKMEAETEAQTALENVMSFYENHPDVEMYGEGDALMFETVTALNNAWGDSHVDLSNPEVLEVVYEAAKDPELLKILQLNPRLFDDDAGMKLARFQANLLRSGETTQPQVQQVPASQVGQRKPFVESASPGATPPASTQLDEFDEAVQAYRKARARTGDSVFFG